MQALRILSNFFFAVLCTFCITKSFAEPVNINAVRKELKTYYNSGQYFAEISRIAQQADNHIAKQVQENLKNGNQKKLAIVLDIDETSLSYYESMAQRNFCYNPIAAQKEILKANAPPIKPILSLYKHAVKNKVAVFFITGRPASTREATINNLKLAGYTEFKNLYTKPLNYNKNSIQEFKAATRASIEEQGYTIVASIGDQKSDLRGGHALNTFKLPNPYYRIA